MFNFIKKDLFFLRSNRKVMMTVATIFIGMLILCYIAPQKEEGSSQSLLPSDQVLKIGVIDEDGSKYSGMLVNYFENTDTFSNFAKITIGKKDDIRGEYEKGNVAAYLIIPKGFVKSLIRIDNIPIEAVINDADPVIAILFKNVLSSYERYISSVEINSVGLYDMMNIDEMPDDLISKANDRISVKLVMTALGRASFFRLNEVEKFPPTKVGEYYVYATMAVIILYLSLLTGMMYQRECRNRTFFRMRLIKGYWIRFLCYTMVRNVMMVSLLLCFGFRLYGKISGYEINDSMYVVIILFSLVMQSIMMFISSLFINSKTYLIVTNVMILLSCIVGGCAIPIMYLPSNFMKLSKLMPSFRFIKEIMRLKNLDGEIGNTVILFYFVIACVCFYASCVMVNFIQGKKGGALYE